MATVHDVEFTDLVGALNLDPENEDARLALARKIRSANPRFLDDTKVDVVRYPGKLQSMNLFIKTDWIGHLWSSRVDDQLFFNHAKPCPLDLDSFALQPTFLNELGQIIEYKGEADLKKKRSKIMYGLVEAKTNPEKVYNALGAFEGALGKCIYWFVNKRPRIRSSGWQKGLLDLSWDAKGFKYNIQEGQP